MKCPLCNGKQVILSHNKVWSKKNSKVYRCKNCDVTFVFPIMSDEEEKAFYRDYNKHVKKRGVIQTINSKEFHQKSKMVARERYSVIKKYFRKGKTILEVGSSTGAFLELLEGKECYAIESADDNREFSKQFTKEVYSDISELPENKKFDIICMFHVFEHFKNPLAFLNDCRKHLVKGGSVLIEVPHSDDPLISLYNCKNFKDFYFMPMHPYVYSVKALDYIFTKAKFYNREVIYHSRYGLDNHLAWLTKGKPGGDPYFKELFANNTGYKKKLQEIKKNRCGFLYRPKITREIMNDGDNAF